MWRSCLSGLWKKKSYLEMISALPVKNPNFKFQMGIIYVCIYIYYIYTTTFIFKLSFSAVLNRPF